MKRYFLIDNFKLLTIFFVVYGHMVEPLIQRDSIIKVAYLSIYSFHMPAFVFVSGMLTSATLSDGRVKKLVKSILVPFIVFTIMYEIFNYLMHGEFSGYTKNLQPYWLLWFLFSLFVWRLLLPVVIRFRFAIILTIIVALGAGYFRSIGYFFGISRTLYFFPFFIFGYKLATIDFLETKFMNTPKLILLGILAANIALFIYYYDMPHQWLYGSYSYYRLGYSDWTAAIIRLVIYAVSFLTLMSIFLIMPNKEIRTSKYGENSLYVYVWHGFLVKILAWTGIIGFIAKLPAIVILIVLFGISGAVTLLLSTDFVAKYTQQLILQPANKILLK